MKIKVSDRVKFLNDTGSGVVTRIIDQKTALVQVDDGFEVPWVIRDLVVDSGTYNTQDEEETPVESAEQSFSEITSEESGPERIEDEEVVLAFVPDDTSADFETFLINSSSYNLKYTISRQQEGEMILFHEDTLEPGIKISLGNYRPGNVNDEEFFRLQGVFFNRGFFRNVPPLDSLIKVSASELYNASYREETDYFVDKAILHTVYSWKKKEPAPSLDIDAETLKKAMYTKGDVKAEKKAKSPGIEEVDLHIEKLTEDASSMDSSEILDIQMNRFRTALESAIIHKTGKIVFIHGVGNGRLKHRLRNILDTEYKSLRYQDASFKEYGYGATMVMIR